MSSAVTSSIPDPFTWLPAESLDGDGYLTTTSYDASGNFLSSTDPLGNTTSYVYNRFNEVLQETDADGNTTNYTYDSHGNELTMTDADGNITSYAYNSNGEQCAMLNANGYVAGDTLSSCPSGSAPYVTAYGYDAEGDQTSVTVYDGTGNTVSATYVTSNLYNSAGEECASLSADGYATGDRIGSSCPTSGAAYETVDTEYDVFGNVLSSISPTNAGGGTTTTTYDADGNELTTTDPARRRALLDRAIVGVEPGVCFAAYRHRHRDDDRFLRPRRQQGLLCRPGRKCHHQPGVPLRDVLHLRQPRPLRVGDDTERRHDLRE
jgi:YD repeat-containing protein